MSGTPEAGLSRRDLLRAGGVTVACYCLAADPVLAQAIRTDTEGLRASDFTVTDGRVAVPVYEARPAAGGGHPIVLCISEIFGLHEYIKDTARRFAKEGFHAVAPELFAREGGVTHLTDIQAVLKIVLNAPREQVLGDCAAVIDWAQGRPGARADRVGVTGWCWGGSTVYQVAGTNRDVTAAVAWYGPPARPYRGAGGAVTGFDLVRDIKVPFLGLYGENDTNPKPDDARKFGELLRQAGNRNVEIVIYPGAGHAFHADYRRSYHEASARDGWVRCVAFFRKHLA